VQAGSGGGASHGGQGEACWDGKRSAVGARGGSIVELKDAYGTARKSKSCVAVLLSRRQLWPVGGETGQASSKDGRRRKGRRLVGPTWPSEHRVGKGKQGMDLVVIMSLLFPRFPICDISLNVFNNILTACSFSAICEID
jgi:hypothetical protein